MFTHHLEIPARTGAGALDCFSGESRRCHGSDGQGATAYDPGLRDGDARECVEYPLKRYTPFAHDWDVVASSAPQDFWDQKQLFEDVFDHWRNDLEGIIRAFRFRIGERDGESPCPPASFHGQGFFKWPVNIQTAYDKGFANSLINELMSSLSKDGAEDLLDLNMVFLTL